VLTLSAFAIAQPLYDVLGRKAQFFVVRGSEAIDIALFVLGLSFVAPAALVLLLGLSWLCGGRIERVCLLGLVASLTACTVLPPLNRLAVSAAPAIGAAVAIGLAGAAGYARWAGARSFVTALSVCVVAFPAWFVLGTPLARLAFPRAPAAMRASGASDTPVIFVVFDLLPTTSLMDEKRRIDAERFPSFAALAAHSTWYRYASTVAPDTAQSVAAITTGLRPDPGKLPLATDYPVNLFTLLAPSHELFVFESQTQLCPPSICDRGARPDLGTRPRLSATACLRSARAGTTSPRTSQDERRSGPPSARPSGAGRESGSGRRTGIAGRSSCASSTACARIPGRSWRICTCRSRTTPTCSCRADAPTCRGVAWGAGCAPTCAERARSGGSAWRTSGSRSRSATRTRSSGTWWGGCASSASTSAR
jgi:hypothetical protein